MHKSLAQLYLHWEWISSRSVYFFLYLCGLKYSQRILLLHGEGYGMSETWNQIVVSESEDEAFSMTRDLHRNFAEQSIQKSERSSNRALLNGLRGERPNPKQHYQRSESISGISIKQNMRTIWTIMSSSIRTRWRSARIGNLLIFTLTKGPPHRIWKVHRNGVDSYRIASAATSI